MKLSPDSQFSAHLMKTHYSLCSVRRCGWIGALILPRWSERSCWLKSWITYPWLRTILWVPVMCSNWAIAVSAVFTQTTVPSAGTKNVLEVGLLWHMSEVSFARLQMSNVQLQVSRALQHQSAHDVCGLEQHPTAPVSVHEPYMWRSRNTEVHK